MIALLLPAPYTMCGVLRGVACAVGHCAVHACLLTRCMMRAGNKMGAAGAASLAPALCQLTGLTQLDLAGE